VITPSEAGYRGRSPRCRHLELIALVSTAPTPAPFAGPVSENLGQLGPASDDPGSSRAGWKLLREAIAGEWAFIALGMLLAVGWSMGRVALPLLVREGIDRGVADGGSVWQWAGLIALAGVVSAVSLGLRRYVAFRNARIIEARLRRRVFAHLQRLHFSFHDANATGDLMSRANTDLQNFQEVLTMIPLTTGQFLLVLASVVIMLVTEPVLAILALIGLPLVNFLGRRFMLALHPTVLGVQRESAELATVVEETVAGVRVVKGFGAEAVRAEALRVEAEDLRRESLKASLVRSRYLPAMEVAPNVGLIAVLAYGGHQVLDGNMTIGTLVSFNIYVLLLVQPLRMLGMTVANAQRAAGAGARISQLMATEPRIVAPPEPKTLPATGPRGRVEFRDVHFGYDPALPVLNGLTLTIEPGESVAIVGATGSGKSTVANLIPRFYDAQSGSVVIDGVDVTDLDPARLRRKVSIVFEETFLFAATIRDNIAFANPEATDAEVVRAATMAGAQDFVSELALGYDTEVGERGFSLSGGQRQRLAIARALLADPRVLILDDATSAVDPTKEHEIRDALNAAMESRTTLVIAHRPATVALAERVLLIDEGRVVAEGTHKQLLAANPRYREVLAADEGGS